MNIELLQVLLRVIGMPPERRQKIVDALYDNSLADGYMIGGGTKVNWPALAALIEKVDPQ